jgi:hypothetical protein
MMRNPKMDELDVLLGRWNLTLSDAWFLEPPGTELDGGVSGAWLGDAFVFLQFEIDGHPGFELAIGRSDPRDAYVALYHDERGVSRLFHMTFDGTTWMLSREDPDFHQRFLAEVEPHRIVGRWEASEDAGRTWRKDYDLTIERTPEQP